MRDRTDGRNIAGVAYGGPADAYLAKIRSLFPDCPLCFVYNPVYKQDADMAAQLRSLPAQLGQELIIRESDRVTRETFKEKDFVYFSWYTVEALLEDGAASDLFIDRIVIASSVRNVREGLLAVAAVSPLDTEIGALGADLLNTIELKGTDVMGTLPVPVPEYHYLINTATAKIIGVNFPPAVLKNAWRLYGI